MWPARLSGHHWGPLSLVTGSRMGSCFGSGFEENCLSLRVLVKDVREMDSFLHPLSSQRPHLRTAASTQGTEASSNLLLAGKERGPETEFWTPRKTPRASGLSCCKQPKWRSIRPCFQVS